MSSWFAVPDPFSCVCPALSERRTCGCWRRLVGCQEVPDCRHRSRIKIRVDACVPDVPQERWRPLGSLARADLERPGSRHGDAGELPPGRARHFQRDRASQGCVCSAILACPQVWFCSAAERIIQETCRLLDAERSTLFYVDGDELVLMIAKGAKNIRLPKTRGIAGHVASTGETVNIPDAHSGLCMRLRCAAPILC